MTGRRKLWMAVTAAVLVVSLLASILLVFADEYVPSVAPSYTPAYTPAPTPVPAGQPFTQPGNGQVEDHVEDGTGSKEFYTVQTGNGNTFYLVIDKDRLDDNAYLLSQVDEEDLMEFVKDEAPEETPQVVLEETPEPVTEEEHCCPVSEYGKGKRRILKEGSALAGQGQRLLHLDLGDHAPADPRGNGQTVFQSLYHRASGC